MLMPEYEVAVYKDTYTYTYIHIHIYIYTYIHIHMPCRMMEMACNQCTDDVLNDGDDI